MQGQAGHNTRPLAQLTPSFLGMDPWMTPQLNVALIRKLRGAFMCLAFFFDVIHGCLYNQALAVARSNGAGPKCL